MRRETAEVCQLVTIILAQINESEILDTDCLRLPFVCPGTPPGTQYIFFAQYIAMYLK